MKQKIASAILSTVHRFVQEQLDPNRPLLLGYSGGPDSKALLYALHACKGIALHVAHIDHGWRKESAQQAEELRKEVEGLGHPFYQTTLQGTNTSNAEDRARQERLRFFRSLFEKYSFGALLLAHQADDLAETVLKRALEGAHLSFLYGMEPLSQYEGMQIGRPLLSIRRKQILDFLSEQNLVPIVDPTNEDPAYLRARMRLQMFPFLQTHFGKEVMENLICLSERARELSSFLTDRVKEKEKLLQEGPWGSWICLQGLHRIEQRHLLQRMAVQKGKPLPRTILEPMLDALEKNQANWRVRVGSLVLEVDRGKVFFLTQKGPVFDAPYQLREGVQRCGDWQIELSQTDECLPPPDWKAVWKGHFTMGLQKGNYVLKWGQPDSDLKKLWSAYRVPAFLRAQLPFLWQEERKEIQDFLSGRPKKPEKKPLKLVFSCVSKASLLNY